jgi:hypothetical protein
MLQIAPHIDMATCEDFLNNVGAVLSIKWYLGIAIGKKSSLSCLCNIMDQLNIVIGVNFTIVYKIPNGCKLFSCCNYFCLGNACTPLSN